jgi:hypothetical protein
MHQRRKQSLAGILLLGGAGTEGIQALRLQKPLPNSPNHHTEQVLLTQGTKIVSSNMVVTSMRDLGGLSNEMTM